MTSGLGSEIYISSNPDFKDILLPYIYVVGHCILTLRFLTISSELTVSKKKKKNHITNVNNSDEFDIYIY